MSGTVEGRLLSVSSLTSASSLSRCNFREVHQRLPLPCGEAELSYRAHEEVRAGVSHPPQEGQEVHLQQGVQACDQAGVREPRGQEAAPCVRQNPEERLQL